MWNPLELFGSAKQAPPKSATRTVASNDTSIAGYLKAASVLVFTTGGYILARATGVFGAGVGVQEEARDVLRDVSGDTAKLAVLPADTAMAFVDGSRGHAIHSAVDSAFHSAGVRATSALIDDSGFEGMFEELPLSEVAVDMENLPRNVGRKLMSIPSAEFQANTYIYQLQVSPSVAALANGGFVVTWSSRDGQDGSSAGVFGQLYGSSGSRVGSEFLVNTNTLIDQGLPSVATLTNGNFIVMWEGDAGNSYGVHGQLYDSSGARIGSEFQIKAYSPVNRVAWYPFVAALNTGGFVATWSDADGSGYGVFGQRYDNSGVTIGAEFQMNTYTASDQMSSSIAPLMDGGFVGVWNSNGQDGSLNSVYGQCYDNSGTKVGNEFQINSYVSNNQQQYRSSTGLTNGGFLVTWASQGQDGSGYGVYGQRYGHDCMKIGTEFQVNTYTISEQLSPSLAGLDDGGFMISWSSYGQDGSGFGIYGQRHDSNGTKIGGEFQLNIYTPLDQHASCIAKLSTGGVVATWQSAGQDGGGGGPMGAAFDYGVFGRLYPPNDTPVLVNNALTITRDQSLLLNSNILSATDGDDDNTVLIFTVSNVQNGRFELTASPGVAITSFTQQQVTSGVSVVRFMHAGGNAPGYFVSVSDGVASTTPVAATISFDAASTNEFQVNTYTTSDQDTPVVAAFPSGGFVVVWQSNGQDGSLQGVYGQRYDSSSAKVGAEFQVNTYTANDQDYPRVAVLTSGGFVVVWQSNGQDGSLQGVYGQRYDNSGATVGSEFQVNTYTVDEQQYSAIAALTNGGFVVAWMTNTNSQGGDSYGICGQRYDSAGAKAGAEFQINTYTASQQIRPSVASFTNGGFVVTWMSIQDGSDYGVYGQRYDSAGVKAGAEFQINTYTVNGQYSPRVAVLTSGGFVVTWWSDGQDGSSWGVYGQRYDSSGIQAGTEFRVNTYTPNGQAGSSVAALNNGFVVAWSSDGQDGSGVSAYGQRYDSNGVKIGAEFQINTYTTGDQSSPVVTALNNGKFVVVWSSAGQDGSGNGVYGRIYSPNTAAPVLVNNALTVSQGQTLVLTATNLSATDSDTSVGTLAFTVSSVQNGQFELTSNAGVAITSFTQQQVTDGVVKFVHTGGQSAPSYLMSVSDGVATTTPIAATISFNVTPVLGNNVVTINQGQTLVLTAAHLSATDGGIASGTLTFTVSNVQNAQFEFGSNPGVPITSFTQQQVWNGAVRFVHAGGQNAPSYTVSVSDGTTSTTPVAPTINFTVGPVLGNNALTVGQGQSVILTATHLSATDSDTVSGTLTFTVSSVQNGRFELTNNSGIAITSFTQQQVTDGVVRFVHTGGVNAPSYLVSVGDGTTSTMPIASTVNFALVNASPLLAHNALTINQGQTIVLTTKHLSATDSDTSIGTLTFTVSGVQNGRFELASNLGVAITSFTQQQVSDGDVRFVHAGGQSAPSYLVCVSDGSTSTTSIASTINFTLVNASPILANNALTINQGQTLVLTSTQLSATDVDNASGTLSFTVSNVQNSRFELTTNPNVAVTSFTQQQVTNSLVRFVHDGGQTSPSYMVSVSDGVTSTMPVIANIRFSVIANVCNMPAVLVNNTLTINQGQTLVLTAANFNATDSDTSAGILTFTVSNVQNGRFELTNNAGIAVTSFTQQQISNGVVRFVHTGEQKAPSYLVSVSDGNTSTTPIRSTIQFNAAPSLANNAITITQGEKLVLGSINLSITDTTQNSTALIFTITKIQHARFELVSKSGVEITSFTQQQVNDNVVVLIDDGSAVPPTYQMSVNNGVFNTALSLPVITFISASTGNKNDKAEYLPKLVNNRLSINNGQQIMIGSNELLAAEARGNINDLVLTIGNLVHGRFENSLLNLTINRFVQSLVHAGNVRFVHAGDNQAPAYTVTVSNGAATANPEWATISFSDAPQVLKSKLSVTQGQAVVLTSEDFNSTSKGRDEQHSEAADSEISYDVKNVKNGVFAYANVSISQPIPADKILTNFTQKQINDGEIQFVHDGSLDTPSCEVTVRNKTSDAKDTERSLDIDFEDKSGNQAPKLSVNNIQLKNGSTTVVDLEHLRCEDDKGVVAPDVSFVVSDCTGGNFKHTKDDDDTGVVLNSFTQSEVARGEIKFVPEKNKKSTQSRFFVQSAEDSSITITPRYTLIAQSAKGLRSAAVSASPMVQTTNQAPVVLQSVENQRITVGVLFQFTLPSNLFRDPEGSPLRIFSYELNRAKLPNWVQLSTDGQYFEGQAVAVGTTPIQVSAMDPEGAAVNVQFAIESQAASESASTQGESSTTRETMIGVGAGLGGVLVTLFGVYCAAKRCNKNDTKIAPMDMKRRMSGETP